MKDVAERAGVSVTTVSHVLNKTRHRTIALGTRHRVLQVVQELNYYTNAHARRLAKSRSDSFGLIVSEIANPFFSEVIKGFEASAMEHGFELLLCYTEYDQDRTQAAVRKMIENKVRGVAAMTSTFDRAFAEELATQHVPVVLLGPGPAQPGISQIQIDFSQGMGQAIDHLRELGHNSFAFISGPLNIRSAVNVRSAFVESLVQRGLGSFRTVDCNYKVDGGISAIRSLLAHPNFPTAILCGNDLIGLGAISALEEVGISVPEDVSVVGYDDILFARLARPPLTTVTVPRERLGKLAYEALEKMQRSKQKSSHYLVETQLVVRKSAGPPRNHDLQIHAPALFANKA